MDRAYDVGVQSVVFQDHRLVDLLSELDGTPVDHVEVWCHHLSPSTGEPARRGAFEALSTTDVGVCGYGVVDIDAAGGVRAHVDFADRLGADYVTVNYPPDADAITEELVVLAEEYAVDVGIHNYSSVHHDDLSTVFSTMADVRGVLNRYDHDRLGLCVDTGHFLVEDVAPAAVVREFGDQINSVHLKDTSGAAVEDVPGAGRLDIDRVVALLDAHADLAAPLVVEYELPQDRAREALREATGRVRAALE